MFNQGMNWINIATGWYIQINFENNPMTTSGTYNYIRKFMFHFRSEIVKHTLIICKQSKDVMILVLLDMQI